MGVDITTYRSRIGTYKHGNGIDVCTEYIFVDFSGCFKVIGSVAFIGTLLIIAGIESNPGPKVTDIVIFISTIAVVLLGVYISNKYEVEFSWKTRLFVLWCMVTVASMVASSVRSTILLSSTGFTFDAMEDKSKNVSEHVPGQGDHLVKEERLVNPTLHRDAMRMLEELGLKDKFPGKIHIRDPLTICPGENKSHTNTVKDIPWIFVKKILSMNSDAMDIRSKSSDKGKNTKLYSVSDLYKSSSDSAKKTESFSPLDVLILVFQCCDPMLKQLIFSKLYHCKLAVPFLHLDCFSKPSVSVWPLRSIAIGFEHGKTLCEESVLDLPMQVLTVARFRRPNMSKSKLLNRILGSTDTFFHRDCPCGTKPRFLSAGYVEMFFMPSVGDKKQMFDSSVTFLNMRGDIKSDYDSSCQQFISEISDLITIVCDINSIKHDKSSLCEIIFQFSAVILIIASPLDVDDDLTRSSLEELERQIVDKGLTKLKILCSHNHEVEKNSTELVTEISENMSELLTANRTSETLATRLTKSSKGGPASDEGTICVEAKHAACIVIKAMEKQSAQETWLKTVTPVQTLSRGLRELLKQQYRCNQEFTTTETIKGSIRSIREKQLGQISEPMHIFINYMETYKDSQLSLHYFLGWLHYFLEHKKRTVLPKLMQENHSAWNRYRQKKKEGRVTAAELNTYEMSIKEVEGKIEKASFGLDNLFRELGQICDAAIFLDIKNTEKAYKLPSIHLLADITAQLVCSGQIFELLDGNSFYMPQEWIKLVFRKVNKLIGGKRVFTLSVLGVQSSGKSTLLNTMFGLQLSASSGRCTKGIHSQLIPRQETNKSPFQYVLVIDTEGLRAPELSERNYQRDNELSTIITGLGDVTLLNVMGENCVEIRDILQIIVHALLRIKLANNKLDIHKSCFFIHQNVADISARDKMKTGLQLLVRNLDTATKEAAESEGILDISTFNQVIEFETEKNVWYLPNLWLGNPPMARVNGKYSVKVVEIKMNIIERATTATNKSFKTLEDIVTHTEDLWKAVLAEDFVFSFRNSLEKKAYIELEKEMKKEMWNFDSRLDDKIYQLVYNEFSLCDTLERLRESKSEMTQQVQRLIAETGCIARENLECFFEENNYKDTIIQWKQQSLNRLQLYLEEFILKKKEEIHRLLSKREVDIMITLQHTEHEEELRKKSMELANELKGKNIGLQETEEKFEQIWARFVDESVSSTSLQRTNISLKKHFIEFLSDIYDHHPVLSQVLDEHNKLMEDLKVDCLSGSFQLTDVTEEDISLRQQPRTNVIMKLFFKKDKTSFKLSADALEHTFQSFDYKIRNICKKDKEITDRDIKCFMKNVKTCFDDVQCANCEKFSLTTKYIIKCFVHVSSFACSQFEAANLRYQNSHGVKARLAKYKCQVKDRFYAHLNDRKAEETAALLLRHAIENQIKDTIKESMSTKVKTYLRGHLPMLKYHLILDILSDLVQQQSFHSFRNYIQSAKSYAESWVTAKADGILYSTHRGRYAVLAETEIEICFEDISHSISKVAEELPDSFSIEEWLDYFICFLQKYKFPNECFRDVLREQERFSHLHSKHFEENMRKELVDLKYSLMKEFKSKTKTTITWSGFNPVEEIFEDIWGCQEHCCFCFEPCIRAYFHGSTSHSCLQHRPQGCRGIHEKTTQKLWLRSCNYDVTTDATGTCSLFSYLCNPEEKKDCVLEKHPYNKYREFLPNWDIEPTTDMEERSQFWLWYIAQYKTNIANYYKVDVSDVPSSWNEISEEQALSSLYTRDDDMKSDLQR